MEFIIDKTIYVGRPKHKREYKEELVYDVLDKLDIKYNRIDHSPADNIGLCHKIEEYANAQICKNIFLTNNKKDYFCLLLTVGDKKYEAGKVSRQLGTSRLSFAGEDLLMNHLSLTSGSVSITGLLSDVNNKVKLAVDSDLIKNELFCFHPNINTSTIIASTSDIFNKFIPYTNHEIKIVDI